MVLSEDEIATVEGIVDNSSDINTLKVVQFGNDDVQHFGKDAFRCGTLAMIVNSEVVGDVLGIWVLQDLDDALLLLDEHIFQVVVRKDNLQWIKAHFFDSRCIGAICDVQGSTFIEIWEAHFIDSNIFKVFLCEKVEPESLLDNSIGKIVLLALDLIDVVGQMSHQLTIVVLHAVISVIFLEVFVEGREKLAL